MKKLAGWAFTILAAVVVIAIVVRAFARDVIDLPALSFLWGTELLVLAAIALPLGLLFKLVELYLSRRHRATSKS